MRTLAISSRFCCLCGPSASSRFQQTRWFGHKVVANIPEIAWQSGRQQQPAEHRNTTQQQMHPQQETARCATAALNRAHTTARRGHRGSFYGDAYPMYSQVERSPKTMPRFVPATTKLHDALAMPIDRQKILFNPWTILLELLHDPRLDWDFDNNKLLIAIGHLNWVHVDNLMAQRPLFAKYLFSTGCLRAKEGASTQLPDRIMGPEERQGTDLSPAQLTTFCQTQWPRYIDQMMREITHAPSTGWDSAWLSANLSMLELQAAFKKTRIVFGARLGMRKQFGMLVRSSFDHSPGLALNTLMSWGGEYAEFLTPYNAIRLTSAYFPNVEVAQQRIGEAWMMFNHLIYCNRHAPPPQHLDLDTPIDQRSQLRGGGKGYASDLFASLQAFDHQAEAARILSSMYHEHQTGCDNEPSHLHCSSLDHVLIERYLKLQAGRIPQRKPPITNVSDD